jgi:methenyltetrahydrofolate cyclohydrolase
MERLHLLVAERAHTGKTTIAAVSGLREQPLESFLDEVASPTPAPGGGSSAGVALALAAALVEMSARLAGESGPAARAGELRARGVDLAEEELSSYAPVLDAMRLPRDDPERPARVEGALLEASRAPVAIAEAAAELAELGAEVAAASSASVRGDVVTGTLLAEAAAAAAAHLVEINLAGRPSADPLSAARQARARAAAGASGVRARERGRQPAGE